MFPKATFFKDHQHHALIFPLFFKSLQSIMSLSSNVFSKFQENLTSLRVNWLNVLAGSIRYSGNWIARYIRWHRQNYWTIHWCALTNKSKTSWRWSKMTTNSWKEEDMWVRWKIRYKIYKKLYIKWRCRLIEANLINRMSTSLKTISIDYRELWQSLGFPTINLVKLRFYLR